MNTIKNNITNAIELIKELEEINSDFSKRLNNSDLTFPVFEYFTNEDGDGEREVQKKLSSTIKKWF